MKIADLFAALSIRADRRSFDQGRREVGKFAQETDRRLNNLRVGLNRRGTDAARNFAGGLGVGSIGAAALGAALVSTAKDSLAFEESLIRLDVSARGTMGTMEQIQDQILKVSNATGVSKESLAEGSAAFVALTGDGKTAAQVMDVFARTQVATGAAMEDIVASAAAISQQLGVQGPEFERMFSILIAGGKAGKIELKDMAGLMASLSASFKQFGGSSGLGGAATIGAAFQVAAQNFGSASEAATGLEALMGSIIQNAKKLKKAGVDVFDGAGNLKSLQDIVTAMSNKNFGPTKLIELLGRKEAFKTFQALRDNRRTWDDITASTMKATDVADDYAKVSEARAVRAKKAWNQLKNEMTSIITPERLEGAAETAKDVGEAAGGWLNVVKKFPGWALLRKGGEFAGFMSQALTEVGTDSTLSGLSDETLRSRIKSGRSATQFGVAPMGFDRAQLERLEAEQRRRDQHALVDRKRAGEDGGLLSFVPKTIFDDSVLRAGGRAPQNQSITLGGLNVTVNAETTSDAGSIADMVTKRVRQAWEKAARDIQAATVQ